VSPAAPEEPVGHTATVGSTGGRRGGGGGGGGGGRGGGGRRRRRGDPNAVVPDAEFTSYYGRPVVRPSPWTYDIPAYLFLGGLAGVSSLLAEGGALTGRPALARSGRLTAVAAIGGSFYFLVHDLGRPERFINMLRVLKPTSPMSVGTWVLTAYAPGAAVAGAAALVEVLPPRTADVIPGALRTLLAVLATPAGLLAALMAPAVANYTAVLLADTATPAWAEARRELPFVFISSASAAAGGAALIGVPLSESGPARRAAVVGAVAELALQIPMRRSIGLAAETLDEGFAGRWHRASQILTGAGAVLTALSGRSRPLSALAGMALLSGSLATRCAIFYAGQASAKDPKYTVVPQRERVDARNAAAAAAAAA
jgi:formate-dependent nitrite reductase membrane component NrfD